LTLIIAEEKQVNSPAVARWHDIKANQVKICLVSWNIKALAVEPKSKINRYE